MSILNNVPGLSIPAFIIGGIGGLLYYQNATGDWNSWAYAWTLIPGFVGLGLLFFSIQTKDKGTQKAGFILLYISAILFSNADVFNLSKSMRGDFITVHNPLARPLADDFLNFGQQWKAELQGNEVRGVSERLTIDFEAVFPQIGGAT